MQWAGDQECQIINFVGLSGCTTESATTPRLPNNIGQFLVSHIQQFSHVAYVSLVRHVVNWLMLYIISSTNGVSKLWLLKLCLPLIPNDLWGPSEEIEVFGWGSIELSNTLCRRGLKSTILYKNLWKHIKYIFDGGGSGNRGCTHHKDCCVIGEQHYQWFATLICFLK